MSPVAAAISNAENRMTTTLRQKKVHLHGWNVEVNKTEASSRDHMLHMPEEEFEVGIV